MARILITGQAGKAVSRNSITAPEPSEREREMAEQKPERNLLKEIRDTLGMTAKDMIREWKDLPEKDKNDIRKGVEDGTLTY